MRAALFVSLLCGAAFAAACDSFSESDSPLPDAATPDDGGAPTNDGAPVTPAEGGATDAPALGCTGLCPTFEIARSSAAVPWLALDATRVVWMTGGIQGATETDLFRCPKTGCASPPKIAGPIPGGYLTSDGTNVWVGGSFQNQGVKKLEGDILQPAVPTKNGIFSMVARDGLVFFATYFEGDGAFARTVYSFDPKGGAPKLVGTYEPASTINTSPMAVSKTRVFLGAHNTGVVAACALSSCSFSEISSGDGSYVVSMATDDVRVFWANISASLVSCGVDETSCTPRVELPSSAGVPKAVIHHDGMLFVETQGGDMIECKSTDCAGTFKVIAHEAAFDIAAAIAGKNFAADATSVFYVAKENADYVIKRLSRTGK